MNMIVFVSKHIDFVYYITREYQPRGTCFLWYLIGSNLRLDSMSQILTHCNVRSGSRLMVVESCNGLLLGAILERMAGIYAKRLTLV